MVYKILKYVVGVVLMLSGIGGIFQGSFVGGVLIFLSGLILIPAISDKIKETLKAWQNKAVRVVSFVGLCLLGFAIIGTSVKGNSVSSKKSVLINYIKNYKQDKSIENIRELGRIGELFDNGNYSTVHPHDGYISEEYDSINKVMLLTFNPKFRYSLDDNTSFLREDDTNGKITSYIVKFEINQNDSIVSKRSYISYSKNGTVEYENQSVPELTSFINSDLVETMRLEKDAEKLVAKQQEEYDKRAKEFEDNCFSSWDGSHVKLKQLIRENLNDPDSFEHVETKYRLQKDYAVVTMKFRGSNAFGAIVLNQVTAKISLKDCIVLEVLQD